MFCTPAVVRFPLNFFLLCFLYKTMYLIFLTQKENGALYAWAIQIFRALEMFGNGQSFSLTFLL